MLCTDSVRQNKLCTGLQKFLIGHNLIPTATEDLCLVWKQMPWSTGQHPTYWADPHGSSHILISQPPPPVPTPTVWQAKLSPSLRWAFQLKVFQGFAEQAPLLNTWLWKFKQRGIHFVTVTFLPNNKVSHMEVLAVNKEWISSRGQRQFFYRCNMVMQNLKNRKQTFFRSHW